MTAEPINGKTIAADPTQHADEPIGLSFFIPVVAAVVLCCSLVSPTGDYATGDDWIHARVVDRLLHEGYYRGHSYLSANFVAQAYWGAAFSRLLGFHFATLRYSTLAALVLAGWGVCLCGSAVGLRKPASVFSALIVVFNPIVLSLAYTFMSDVPFLAAVILSGLCYLQELKRPGRGCLLAANVLAVLAFFIRQNGAILPIAFVVTLPVAVWRGRYPLSWRTFVELTLPWIAGAALYFWSVSFRDSGTALFQPLGGRLFQSVTDGIRQPFVGLCYMGLFAFPIGLLAVIQLARHRYNITTSTWRLWTLWTVASLAAFLGPGLLATGIWYIKHKESPWLEAYAQRMPLLPKDTLFDLGVGYVQVPDMEPQVRIGRLWWIPTAVGIAIAAWFAAAAWSAVRSAADRRALAEVHPWNLDDQRLFLVVWCLAFVLTAYNPWRVFTFDRYMLAALPPFVLLLASSLSRVRPSPTDWAAGAAGVLLLAAFSLVCVQDYVGWNRAAWDAENRLITEFGVSPRDVHGVDAYNGWYNSEAFINEFQEKDFWHADLTGKGPWVFDDKYRIGVPSKPPAGYRELYRVPYHSWLGMTVREIAVYERDDSPNK